MSGVGGKGTRHRCVRLRGHVFPFYLFCLFFCLPSAFLGYVFCSLFSPSLLWPPPVSASVQQPDPSFKQRTLLDGKHGPSLRDTWQWKKKKTRKLVEKLRRSSKSKQRNSLFISYDGEEGMDQKSHPDKKDTVK